MALCVFYDTNVLFLLGVFFLAFSACGVCVELEPLCCTRVSWRFEKMGLLFHSHGVFFSLYLSSTLFSFDFSSILLPRWDLAGRRVVCIGS